MKSQNERARTFFLIVTTILLLFFVFNTLPIIKGFLRGMYFIPNILGALVVSYIFIYILPTITQTASMLANKNLAWIAIVIVCAWQSIAMNTLIYISGLQTVPEDVYEAASLDGATGLNRFRYITFPLIMPFFTINMVLCMKNNLMVFDQIMALTKGGQAQSTESISFLIYNIAFKQPGEMTSSVESNGLLAVAVQQLPHHRPHNGDLSHPALIDGLCSCPQHEQEQVLQVQLLLHRQRNVRTFSDSDDAARQADR